MATIEIRDHHTSVFTSAAEGSNLLQLLRSRKIQVPAACGGRGTCGKCKVKIQEHTKRTFKEVLSCDTKVTDGMVVVIDEAFDPADSDLTEIKNPSSDDDVLVSPNECGIAVDPGIAVDLGTTTITANLVDLKKKEIISTITEWNSLIPYGADVISRIHYIMENKDGLKELSQKLQMQIDQMTRKLCRDLPARILIAGNTIMEHIYAGMDPSPMAYAPYIPETLFESDPSLMPCISGFIGGDITSGFYDQEIEKKEGICLFLDMGTNGEMAIGNQNGLLAASVATGPAFEGAQISCGCYGRAGALSHICWDPILQRFDMEILSATLDSMNGICGSGLIDLLADLRSLGIITKEGRILTPLELENVMAEDTICAIEDQLGIDFLREDEDGNGVFYLTDHVFLTTSDVRNLQLAKASLRAGIELLMKKSGKAPGDISQVILAGGFGSNLDPLNLVKTGMLPAAFLDKITIAGNTSLQGASKALTDPSAHEKLLHIKSLCRYIELADAEEFANTFVRYMDF